MLYNHPKIKTMVSCTHGEGYGRPLAEATCCDLPVIASNWSAQLDFLTDKESLLISGFLKEIPKSRIDNQIFVPGMQWAEVDEIDLKKKMILRFQHL